MEKKRIGLGVFIAIAVVLVAGFGGIVNFIADFLWFKELSYTSVFFKKLFTQLQIGIPSFVVILALTYVYLRALKRGYYKRVDIVDTPAVSERVMNRLALGLGAIFAGIVTWAAVTALWFEALKFANATEFSIADPIFKLDVGFFLFKLDFIKQLNELGIGLIIAFVALSVVYYFLLLSLRRPRIFEKQDFERATPTEDESTEYYNQNGSNPFGNLFGGNFGKFAQGAAGGGFGRPQKKQFDNENLKQLLSIASKQLSVLGIIFFFMVGINFFLRQYDLLYSYTGVLYGAGYTDINITLWVYRTLMVLSVLSALLFALGIKKKSYKMALGTPALMVVLLFAGTGIAMMVQNLVVLPDQINKESQYLKNNIVYTQYAYDLQDVSIKPFAANQQLTSEDIQNNMETISNIRINDFEPAKKFYNQTQNFRLYYLFNDVDVDRYMVNGEYTQTFLSAREIDEDQLPGEWLNKHLKYTHGYGVTLSRVDKVTPSGQPDVLIHSIPPVSGVEEIQLSRPEIYFGELTKNYVLANTDEQEFDYPSGDSNIYSTYEGTAGIKLNTFNRLIFAIREQSLKLLVSTNINSDSRIIINRNITERVQKIMPFLSYDDPYIVTADGKLYWMIDAYTYSSNYPYSEPYANTTTINYIRNSVKVVIDAYNGDVSYYLINDKDPVANTYAKIYPALFKTFDKMPEGLQSHIRYPNMLFSIQADVYKRYHMNDVKVFYQGEDIWEVSNEIFGTEEVKMTPNYYIMRLPGEEKAEFINSIPYTPRGKRNMTGLLLARNDGEHYGELILFQLPKGKITYGPMQIESQIDQHTEISKEFSLWNSAGSTYIRGNMFIIPIEESLVYVEPVYLEAANTGSLPEVKRVIVSYGDQIAYEATLGEALESLFGDGAAGGGAQVLPGAQPGTNGVGTHSTAELIELATEAFYNAERSQKNGDWAAYGQYLRQLESYLKQLAPGEPVRHDEEVSEGTMDQNDPSDDTPDWLQHLE